MNRNSAVIKFDTLLSTPFPQFAGSQCSHRLKAHRREDCQEMEGRTELTEATTVVPRGPPGLAAEESENIRGILDCPEHQIAAAGFHPPDRSPSARVHCPSWRGVVVTSSSRRSML